MTEFSRIEARLKSRADLKALCMELTGLSVKIGLIAHDKNNSDEAALLLARQRIKETSQKLRKGQ